MIKLLIVDDSALMRRLLEGIFAAEGDFEVRVARNGAEALDMVQEFDPHVVTLDVQMPEMDGMNCLRRMMIEAPRPVVMFSSLTSDGAETTLEAMELGAVDFIEKPGGAVSLEMERFGPLLVEKVRCAATVRISRALRLRDRIRHQFRSFPEGSLGRRGKPGTASAAVQGSGLVLIGSSTGGPAALDVMLPQLPQNFAWPVLVAQHMPAAFTGPFARRLNSICDLEVVEVNRAMALLPGKIYIGRGDADVVVAPRAGNLSAVPVPGRRDYPWHPSVERMVGSALDHFEARQLACVLLTGMGNDGAEAMKRVRIQGGHTVAESEATAVVWGMPGELAKNGGAELLLSIEEIAAAVIGWVGTNANH